MAFHITKKEAKQTFSNLIALGYCDAQNLIKHAGGFRIAYSSSKLYGWRCDYFLFKEKNFCISTGYSPVGVKPSSEQLDTLLKLESAVEHAEDKTEILDKFYALTEEILKNNK